MLPPPGVVVSTASNALENALPTISSAVFAIATAAPTAALNAIPAVSVTALADGGTMAGSAKGPHREPENGECRLLGNFALIVQGALGGLALMALVYKRWRERPQRPVKIWTFDVSKQVVGSVLVHIANILMSLLSSGQLSIKVDPSAVVQRRDVAENGKYQPNPCSFYLLNLAIDTTIGIPILIILLRIFTALFLYTPFGNPPESIQSGNYGSPPKTWWWVKQSIIYFMGLMGMKICVLIIFILLPWISRVGDWALKWTEGNEQLQVFFVMLFFPVVMNATQYYIIDSFIKNQTPLEHEALASEDDDSFDDRPFIEQSGSSDEIGSSDEDEVPKSAEVKVKGRRRQDRERMKEEHEYDPQVDGEGSPTVVGSSSSSGQIPVHKKDVKDADE